MQWQVFVICFFLSLLFESFTSWCSLIDIMTMRFILTYVWFTGWYCYYIFYFHSVLRHHAHCLTRASISCSFTDKDFMRWSENDSPHESLWWVVKAIFMMPLLFFSSSVLQLSHWFDRLMWCIYFCSWSHGRPENGHLLYDEWLHVSQLHWADQQFHQHVLHGLHPQEERQLHRLPVSPTLNYIPAGHVVFCIQHCCHQHIQVNHSVTTSRLFTYNPCALFYLLKMSFLWIKEQHFVLFNSL